MSETKRMIDSQEIFWSFWQQCSACRLGTDYVLLINDSMDGCLEFLNVTITCKKTINNKILDRPLHVKTYPYPIKDYLGTGKMALLADACNAFLQEHLEMDAIYQFTPTDRR